MKTKVKTVSKKFSRQAVDPSAITQTERDFKDAVMTVSIFVNLFMLCVWVALQSTSQYDAVLANFFLTR